MKKKIRKIVFALTSSVVILSITINEHNYETNYQIIDGESDAFAEYQNGLIYICKKGEENNICLNNEDILIIDDRMSDNPNIKICDSYLICSSDIRNDILSCILDYESMYPTCWDRTIESMRNEWTVHNLLYELNYKKDHTTNVDLDNNDELKYKSKVLTKILFN